MSDSTYGGCMTRQVFYVYFLAITLMVGMGCDATSPTDSSKEQVQSQGGEVLMAPSSSPGRMENNEGFTHYTEGRWDMAEVHFRKSLEVDPGLAEGHFNLGLVLDKQGKHQEATDSFTQALQLAPGNSLISSSSTLQAHIKK